MLNVRKNQGFAVVPVIVATAFVIGLAALYLTKKPDSPVEQAAEAVIKAETGLDVDLSPDNTKVD